MNDIDIEKKAKEMFKDKAVRQEFANDIEVLKAYISNRERVRIYKSENKQSTKSDATKSADIPSDDELKRKWENSAALRKEFDDFEQFAAWKRNEGKVKVLHA